MAHFPPALLAIVIVFIVVAKILEALWDFLADFFDIDEGWRL